MKRWSSKKSEKVENSEIDAYLTEVIEVSRRHGFSIAHEDGHGAFEIEEFDEGNASWLMEAHDNTSQE